MEDNNIEKYQPDYTNIVKAARNIYVEWTPLYEHIISPEVVDTLTGKSFAEFISGNKADKKEYFGNHCKSPGVGNITKYFSCQYVSNGKSSKNN